MEYVYVCVGEGWERGGGGGGGGEGSCLAGSGYDPLPTILQGKGLVKCNTVTCSGSPS